MLDIGFSEILLVFVIALIVLGPEKLPRVAAQVGKWVGRARSMARQFREQLEEEVNVEAARKKQAAEQPPPKPDTKADPTPDTGSSTVERAPGTPESHSSSDTAAHTQSADASVVSSTADATHGEPHLDLTDQPWPYAAPAPPPEVADIFHDLLRPPSSAQIPVPAPGTGVDASAPVTQTRATSSAAPVPPASTAAKPAAEPTQQVLWPHDYDVPPAPPETTNEKALEGAQSATHERGT